MSTETPEARVHAWFVRDVAEHRMEVLRDDGTYRHIRFASPENSWNCWFELVTWPGALCIRGDHGTYVFARTDDMFGFFRMGSEINPSYWGEKCIAQEHHSPVREFEREPFEASVRRYVDEWIESELGDDPAAESIAASLRGEVVREVLDVAEHAETALPAVRDFHWQWWPAHRREPIHAFRFEDWWECLTVEDYSTHYLWCLYAVLWGIRVYDAAGDTSKVKVGVPAYAQRPVAPVSDVWVAAGHYVPEVSRRMARPVVNVVATL